MDNNKKDIFALKKEYRKRGKQVRAQLSADERAEKSQAIERRLFQWEPFMMAENVSAFISFRDEVDTHHLIDLMRVMGKRVYVPIVDKENNELLLSLFHGYHELEESDFGVLEPRKDTWRIKELEEIDFILIPGLLFSKDGYRVGYGGGYYDRLLSKLSREVPRVGICFEEQVVDYVPTAEFDEALDAVVTDQNIYFVNENYK
ncbi:MAG: 5-formyltetrahydrofolate cyclo-ligase [Eubacteriales bacterium]|nr:5-formyltetrahydrofolate cyclo-ligase [Eubacteriales bacterium]MDD4323525.1 5-formyltetrahydrofolate cyclo-ligase [Eubacteriales bacterium]MDD4541371.1 5-formyltetrahydrofolate cyclo-ligase [Eubacteriales bacterium]